MSAVADGSVEGFGRPMSGYLRTLSGSSTMARNSREQDPARLDRLLAETLE